MRNTSGRSPRRASILPDDIHLQAPPNLSDVGELAAMLAAGIDDWGGVSPVTIDHVNPERPWPALETLRTATEAAGHVLAPRLTVHPEFVRDPQRWIDPDLAFSVLVRSDSEGLARDDHWASGGDDPPPPIIDVTLHRRGSTRCRAKYVRFSTEYAPARRSATTRSSRCSRRVAPTCVRCARSPTSCAPRPSATRSRSSATATSTTRTCARSSAASVRSARARCR